jgi:hypothetical protein
MALDFGILQPANISGQLQAGQESAMRNQLAQQQLASGRTEQEMSQMKLSELKRNTAALESMQRKFLENGKSDDMDANYDAMISSGIPHFMDIGIKAKQTLAQTRIDYATMGLPMPSYLQPKGQGAATGALAPGAPAQGSVSKPFTPEQVLEEERRWAQMAMGGSTKGLAPMLDSKGNLLNPMTPERRALDEQRLQQMADGTAGMAMPAVTGRPIQPEQALNVVSRSKGSPSPIPTANMLAPAAAPATNMLAPPPAAPANALAAPGMSVEEQRARTMLLSQNPGVRAAGQAELNRLTAVHALAPGGTLRDASGRIIAQAPEATPADVRTMQMLGYPNTQAGYVAFRDAQRQDRLLTPAEQKQKIEIALASRTPAQPSAPVAVVGEDNKVKYVSREQAMGMTPASALEGLAPKEIQAREAKFPQATSAIKTFETSADKLAGDLEKLAGHPGLSGISGLVYGRTPAVTKDARAAQALYDSIVARGGFQELQNMRSASPTGGALGNVSNQEGQYLRDAFAPINRTQDTADLSRALREAAGATKSSKQRLREAYDMTYDYKSQGGTRPAPAAGGAADPLGIR